MAPGVNCLSYFTTALSFSPSECFKLHINLPIDCSWFGTNASYPAIRHDPCKLKQFQRQWPQSRIHLIIGGTHVTWREPPNSWSIAFWSTCRWTYPCMAPGINCSSYFTAAMSFTPPGHFKLHINLPIDCSWFGTNASCPAIHHDPCKLKRFQKQWPQSRIIHYKTPPKPIRSWVRIQAPSPVGTSRR